MANPAFNCECEHVHRKVDNNTDIQTLERDIFNQPNYTKAQDKNIYFVKNQIEETFEEIYDNLP